MLVYCQHLKRQVTLLKVLKLNKYISTPITSFQLKGCLGPRGYKTTIQGLKIQTKLNMFIPKKSFSLVMRLTQQ